MPKVEIERRWLVKGLTDEELAEKAKVVWDIQQGYLGVLNGLVIRIRSMKTIQVKHSYPEDAQAYLTLKGQPTGNLKTSRIEFDFPIPVEDAEALLPYCGNAVIHKTRYIIGHATRWFEVDRFRDRHLGITIAEIELEEENASVSIPSWCVKEITGNEKFSNYGIATGNGLLFLLWEELNIDKSLILDDLKALIGLTFGREPTEEEVTKIKTIQENVRKLKGAQKEFVRTHFIGGNGIGNPLPGGGIHPNAVRDKLFNIQPMPSSTEVIYMPELSTEFLELPKDGDITKIDFYPDPERQTANEILEEGLKTSLSFGKPEERHRCPKCGSSSHIQTDMAYEKENLNDAECLSCGWRGKVCEMLMTEPQDEKK